MRPRRIVPVLAALTLGSGFGAHSEVEPNLEFELKDQFGVVHRHDDVIGQVVLLNGSDAGGTKYNESWGASIAEELIEHPRYAEIAHLAYADLRGVPFFLKGMIRGKFPKDPEKWALMDWKGEIAKAYQFEPNSTNILIFDRDGSLEMQVSGKEPEATAVAELAATLRALLDRD